MRAFERRRRGRQRVTFASVHATDPLAGVANLFDASIVFAVGLMVALVQAYSVTRLLDPNTQLTITQRNTATGEVEVIEKTGRTMKVRKMTPEKKSGQGTRLGIAYQLPDGSVVYVPEPGSTQPGSTQPGSTQP
jgi:hypothetical protein